MDTKLKIAKFEKNFGLTNTVSLIQTALPIIIQRKETLCNLLAEKDLDEAAAVAHKTLGSVRLYGTDELEKLLLQVRALHPNQSNLSEFKSQMSEEFCRVIEICHDWLKENK